MIPQQMTEHQRHDFARRYVESAEEWLRKLIHYQLSKTNGEEYLSKGNWKRDLIEQIIRKKTKNSAQLDREIDATTFDQAIDILCHPNCWGTEFKVPLHPVYPFGREEARFFLSQLKDIRNEVSHLRNCSMRQLEKAICYSNDLIDAIKAFFKDINMQRVYNVPMIVRYVDSIGNESNLNGVLRI